MIVIAVLVHRAMAKRGAAAIPAAASVAAASPRAVAIASAFAIAGAQVLGCSGTCYASLSFFNRFAIAWRLIPCALAAA